MSANDCTDDEPTLAEWLRGKLSDAEAAVSQREAMEASWRGGTDDEWREVSRATKSKFMPKSARLEEAESHKRIAVRCRLKVEMLKRFVAEVEATNVITKATQP